MNLTVNNEQLKLPVKPVILHLVCWIGYISLEIFSLKYFYGKIESPYIYAYAYATNIAWFYGILWNLNRKLPRRGLAIVVYLLSWLSLIIVYLAFKFVAGYLFYEHFPADNPLQNPARFFVGNLYRGSVFAFLAFFYYMSGHIASYRQKALAAKNDQLTTLKEKAELETKFIQSQNAFLQQQLNPHLLLNTLNFVYAKVYKIAPDGGKAIELLSELLRYSLERSGSDSLARVKTEIEQIRNLVAINRFRYGQPLALSLDIDGEFGDLEIIPLILITLTENIFKHGNLHDFNHPATLSITLDPTGLLKYDSRNLKKPESGHARINRLGLNNIRIRLDNAYRDQYQMDIRETDDFFELRLTLAL